MRFIDQIVEKQNENAGEGGRASLQVPAWGETVYWQITTTKDLIMAAQRVRGSDPEMSGPERVFAEGAHLLALKLEDKDGKRLFTWMDVPRILEELHYVPVDTVAAAVRGVMTVAEAKERLGRC